MMRRKQLGWLAFAALFVLAENAIFFSSQPEMTRGVESDDEDEEFYEREDDAEDLEPLEAVSQGVVDQWLAAFADRARNPFLTLAEAESDSARPAVVSTSMPRLIGTLTSDGRRVAWLDSTARAEGEWIGELEVRRIEGNRVVLARGEEELLLWLRRPGRSAAGAPGEEEDEREDDANE